MSLDELIRLRKEKEDKIKYVPLVRKIDNTNRQLYNFGPEYNKKSIYDNESTRTAIGEIEKSFIGYVSSTAGMKYDNMIAWMDIGVICQTDFAKEYVKMLQETVKLDGDGISYKITADASGMENMALQGKILDDMVAVRIYDITVNHCVDYDTCHYEYDNFGEVSYANNIFLVKFDEFLNVLNALGYRVVSRDKVIKGFQDYLDAFMDYTNEDGFRIVADFDLERKKQKESGDSAFKYLYTSGKKKEQSGGMTD